jgi:hypothetical protein
MYIRRIVSLPLSKYINKCHYWVPSPSDNDGKIEVLRNKNNISKDLLDLLHEQNNALKECYTILESQKKYLDDFEVKILGINNKLNIILLRLISK